MNVGYPADSLVLDLSHCLRNVSIKQWGYPTARILLLCADGGGSNGSRNRAWKYHLQQFADQTGLQVTTCHYPPGTSKWNKIEHRMFSYIINPAIKYVIPAEAKRRAGIHNSPYFLDSRISTLHSKAIAEDGRGNDSGASKIRMFNCHVNTKLRSYIPYSKFGRITLKMPIYLIIFFCTLGILSLNSCSSEGDKTEYKTIRAVKQTFSPAVTALGAVKPEVGAEVRLGARIPGKVEHLYANIGDFVKKGQVIAELEKDELKATVEKQQAELNSAKINLASRKKLGPIEIEKAEADLSRFKATYELETLEYERQTTLFNENITSRQILDLTNEELLVAKADLEASSKTLALISDMLEENLKLLNAQVESAKATLRISEVELSYATLHAPIQGIIASVSTQEGETVAVGLSAPTFVTIIDLGRLQVETYVDEVDIGKIKIGQKATFTVEAFPSIEIEGEVVGINPKAILKENVVFYNVLVKSQKPSLDMLRPEMTANVSIFLKTSEDILMVPASSVKKSGGIDSVYLIENGKPVMHEVAFWKSRGVLRKGMRCLRITAI